MYSTLYTVNYKALYTVHHALYYPLHKWLGNLPDTCALFLKIIIKNLLHTFLYTSLYPVRLYFIELYNVLSMLL